MRGHRSKVRGIEVRRVNLVAVAVLGVAVASCADPAGVPVHRHASRVVDPEAIYEQWRMEELGPLGDPLFDGDPGLDGCDTSASEPAEAKLSGEVARLDSDPGWPFSVVVQLRPTDLGQDYVAMPMPTATPMPSMSPDGRYLPDLSGWEARDEAWREQARTVQRCAVAQILAAGGVYRGSEPWNLLYATRLDPATVRALAARNDVEAVLVEVACALLEEHPRCSEHTTLEDCQATACCYAFAGRDLTGEASDGSLCLRTSTEEVPTALASCTGGPFGVNLRQRVHDRVDVQVGGRCLNIDQDAFDPPPFDLPSFEPCTLPACF
jgi:hypothetical protein